MDLPAPRPFAEQGVPRWGEDGIAGFCDRYQVLALAFAFWNDKDPILKERFFGVVPYEGNHGEDVKEYYFYDDGTLSHSYMKCLYNYPQREYPYAWLVVENQRRQGKGPEFDLLDTGIFDDDRYFDIVVEYAKATWPSRVSPFMSFASSTAPASSSSSIVSSVPKAAAWWWGVSALVLQFRTKLPVSAEGFHPPWSAPQSHCR